MIETETGEIAMSVMIGEVAVEEGVRIGYITTVIGGLGRGVEAQSLERGVEDVITGNENR